MQITHKRLCYNEGDDEAAIMNTLLTIEFDDLDNELKAYIEQVQDRDPLIVVKDGRPIAKLFALRIFPTIGLKTCARARGPLPADVQTLSREDIDRLAKEIASPLVACAR